MFMQTTKIIKNSFKTHCNSDSPFFCNFGHKGLDMHIHMDFFEICLIVSGTYEHTHNGSTRTCKLGTILFSSPGESHSLIATSNESYHYALILKSDFFVDFCKQNQQNAEKILNTPFLIQKVTSIQLSYLTQLVSNLTYTTNQDLLPLVKLFLSNLLFACFDKLPLIPANMDKIYAVDLCQLFNNYEGLDEDISNLYRQFPISRTALINDFKALTNYTIVQYRNIKRMEYAALLLTEANYSVTGICNILKIENPSYFSQQFKKQYGISPKQYQLEHRLKK